MRNFFLTTILISFGYPLHGIAASFDCQKSTTPVERMICSDSEISKLDESVNDKYKAALLKATVPDSVRQKQRHWLKNRNSCNNSGCIKINYINRIDELTEREKELKEIRLKLAIPQYSKDNNYEFCTRLLDSVKNWKNVEVLSPVVTTDSLDDPLLRKQLGKCEPRIFTKTVQIEPRVWNEFDLDSMSESERDEWGMGFITRKGFRLYQANIDNDTKNSNELILYGAGTIQEGADAFDTSVDLTFFKVIDVQNCRTTNSAQVEDVINKANTFVGLLRFESKNYVFNARYYPMESLWGVNIQQWMYSENTKLSFFGGVCNFVAKDQ